MKRTKIEDLKKEILLTIDRLIPVLRRLSEINLHLYDVQEKNSCQNGDFNSSIKDYENLKSFIETVQEMEWRGIREGYRIVKETKSFPLFSSFSGIKKFLAERVERKRKSSPRSTFEENLFIFGLERVTETILRYPRPPRFEFEDFRWLTIDFSGKKLVIPGFTSQTQKIISSEVNALVKISEMLNYIKKREIEGCTGYFPWSVIAVNENSEVEIKNGKRRDILLTKKLKEYIECFFPGCRSILNQNKKYFYFVLYSQDVIFLYYSLFKRNKRGIISYIANDEVKSQYYNCRFYIENMVKGFGNQKITFSPIVVWYSKEFIQNLIPPDSDCVSDDLGIKLFVSKETKSFIQVVEEQEPNLRLTVYPFSYFKKIRIQNNPILELECERI